jgi:hypothetical protein
MEGARLVTGVIRVRIPTAPAPIGKLPGPGGRNGTAPAAPVPAPKPPTLEQQQARALAGMKRAGRRQPRRWGAQGFAFDEWQRDAMDDATETAWSGWRGRNGGHAPGGRHWRA